MQNQDTTGSGAMLIAEVGTGRRLGLKIPRTDGTIDLAVRLSPEWVLS
jgi:hypothetical protein